METNVLPQYDMSDNPTGCCPRFKPEAWDEKTLHFEKMKFVKVCTKSLFHIPLNMGSVFPKTFNDIKNANAFNSDNFVILSYDPSAWKTEHYFSVSQAVPGHEIVEMDGDFLTKVFEGPYKNAPQWCRDMETYVQNKGFALKKTYFFYTTCPKCAKTYGKNYLVAISEVEQK